jgi:hypothetical protein
LEMGDKASHYDHARVDAILVTTRT